MYGFVMRVTIPSAEMNERRDSTCRENEITFYICILCICGFSNCDKMRVSIASAEASERRESTCSTLYIYTYIHIYTYIYIYI